MPTTAVRTPANADWYARNYPAHADWVAGSDPRCWETLSVLGQIHNVVDRNMPDGGLRQCGDGLSLLTRTEVSSFDGSALTDLVVAAHRLHVRVAVRGATVFGVRENPKDYESPWQRLLGPSDVEWSDSGCEPLDRDDFASTSCECCETMLVRRDRSWFHDGYLGSDTGIDDLTETEVFGHPASPEDLVVEPISGLIKVLIHPRCPKQAGMTSMEYHPGLDRLAEVAARQSAASEGRNP